MFVIFWVCSYWNKKSERPAIPGFTVRQLEQRCRELEDAVRVEKMKSSGSAVTTKRLEKKVKSTTGATGDYAEQMQHLQHLKEQLENKIKKYENASREGASG